MVQASDDRLQCSIIRDIHVGGMARLRLGITQDRQQVVFRELLPRNVFRLGMHRAFVAGTKVREVLSPHPLIVLSFERGRNGFVPYEIIEYVDGLSLRRLMQQKDACLDTDCLEILRQAAEALAHVHSKGYVHLDIKPENFIVVTGEEGVRVKLTDFDLSRDAKPRHCRKPAGTAAYLAPEQIRGGMVGQPADIFAFGIMAYQLMTGRMPFHGKNEKQLRWRQSSKRYTPKPPSALNPDLTPKIDRIITRCLEKDPEERYPSMQYLCEELHTS